MNDKGNQLVAGEIRMEDICAVEPWVGYYAAQRSLPVKVIKPKPSKSASDNLIDF